MQHFDKIRYYQSNMKYKHFTVEEREKIQQMLWQKSSIRSIARALNRSPSSVSREIARNKDVLGRRFYIPRTAHERARTRYVGDYMRLSEERIYFIAEKIVDALVSKGMIKISTPAKLICREILTTVIRDLRIEDQIDKEVIEMIKSMSREIPEDSPEWTGVFRQKKEDLARRKNYIL